MKIEEKLFNKIATLLPLLGLLGVIILFTTFSPTSTKADTPYIFLPYLFAYTISVLNITFAKDETAEELIAKNTIKLTLLFNILSTAFNFLGYLWLIYIVEDTTGSVFFKNFYLLIIASIVAAVISTGYAIFVKVTHYFLFTRTGKNHFILRLL